MGVNTFNHFKSRELDLVLCSCQCKPQFTLKAANPFAIISPIHSTSVSSFYWFFFLVISNKFPTVLSVLQFIKQYLSFGKRDENRQTRAKRACHHQQTASFFCFHARHRFGPSLISCVAMFTKRYSPLLLYGYVKNA